MTYEDNEIEELLDGFFQSLMNFLKKEKGKTQEQVENFVLLLAKHSRFGRRNDVMAIAVLLLIEYQKYPGISDQFKELAKQQEEALTEYINILEREENDF